MFNQGNAPFEYYTPSSTIDFSNIPNQFKELIPKLLCSENERISIEVAYDCLKNIFNNDYDEIESHSVFQKPCGKVKGKKHKTFAKEQIQKKKMKSKKLLFDQ